MNEYTPDKWVVVKIKGKSFPLTYKVFGCWFGGFLNGNSWKLNSGITKVTEKDNCYYFEGYSSSIYVCTKGSYGTHLYGAGVLEDIIKRSQEIDVNVEILPEDTNWFDIPSNIS